MKCRVIAIILSILLALALGALAFVGYRCKEKSADYDRLAAELEETSAREGELAAANEALLADLASAEEVNATLAASVAEYEAEVAELEGEVAALTDTVASQQVEIEGYQAADADADAAAAEIAALTAELESANSRIAELEGALPTIVTPEEAAQSSVTVPDGITIASDGTASIGFKNGNGSYTSVTVRLMVAGDEIYESAPVAPGEELGEVVVGTVPAAGEYGGYIVWEARNDAGEVIVTSMAAVTVIAE